MVRSSSRFQTKFCQEASLAGIIQSAEHRSEPKDAGKSHHLLCWFLTYYNRISCPSVYCCPHTKGGLMVKTRSENIACDPLINQLSLNDKKRPLRTMYEYAEPS